MEEKEQKQHIPVSDAERLKAQITAAKQLEVVDYQKSCAAFERALGLAAKLNNKLAEAQCQEGMARMLWKMSDSAKAHRRYRVALAIHTELGNYYGMATSYSGLGIISSISEEYATALEFFEQALSASRKAEHHSFTAVLTANVGNVYFALGRYDDAMQCFQQALDYHNENDNFEQIAIMLTGMAGVYVYTHRYDEGLDLLHRALAMDKKVGRTHGVLMCMYNIGETYRKQGKGKKAVKQQLEVLKLAEKMGSDSMGYKIHEQLSGLYEELDEPEKSAHHLQLFMQAEQEQNKWMVKKENEKLQQFGVADR